jgi:serine/threonine-protein kinase RsbT
MDDAPQILLRLPVRDESDIAAARRHVRELAREHGLTWVDVESLATAVSEIARNALVHAKGGELLLGIREAHGRTGVLAIAQDEGPGIASIENAMRDGYSTGNGLGLGLPSARRLVDEFELRSAVGQGTSITLLKWR